MRTDYAGEFYFKTENDWLIQDQIKRGQGYVYQSTRAPIGAPTLCAMAIGLAIGRLSDNFQIVNRCSSLVIAPQLDGDTLDRLIWGRAKSLDVQPDEAKLIEDRVMAVSGVQHKIDLITPYQGGYRVTDRYYELCSTAAEAGVSFIGIDSAATLLPEGTPEDEWTDMLGTIAQSIATDTRAAVLVYRN